MGVMLQDERQLFNRKQKRRIDGSTIVCDTIKNTGNIEQATVLNHFNS